MKIGVVGSGTMGTGITQTLAAKYKIVVQARREESLNKSVAKIEKSLSRSVEKGRISEQDKEGILSNIVTTVDINDLKDCDLIIEAATENMNTKLKIFEDLDKVCDEKTILATNTSSISITAIGAATKRPEKVIGMHFFNPVPVMKLVEVIKGQLTNVDVKDKIVNLAKEVGKTPIEVEEGPGFVVNRILVPMINEGVGLLADGIASEEDIDTAMKLGANHPMGPLELADLIGLDVCLAIMEVLYEEFGDSKYRPHPLLRKMVRAGLLGRKTGEGFYKY